MRIDSLLRDLYRVKDSLDFIDRPELADNVSEIIVELKKAPSKGPSNVSHEGKTHAR